MRFLPLLVACSWLSSIARAGSLHDVSSSSQTSRIRREPAGDDQQQPQQQPQLQQPHQQQHPYSPKAIELALDSWNGFPPNLRQVLTGIDDRLRGLDAFGSALRLTRLDFSVEQVLRKLDTIDSRLGRLEAKLDVRIEKLEDAFASSRKDNSVAGSDEHLFRRLEAVADKLNNKMAFLETKLDMRADRLTNKLELMERDFQDSSEDAIEKITRGDESRARLHSDVSKVIDALDKLDSSQRHMDIVLRSDVSDVIKRSDAKMDLFSHEILTVTSLLRSMQNNSSQPTTCQSPQDFPTWEQVTNLTELVEKMLRVGAQQFREIDSDVESYTRKVVNGISDLRRVTDEFVRGTLQDTVAQGNRTRVLVREEFRKLHEQIEPLPLIEPKLSLLSEGLERKIVELGATVDHSFATLLVAQNSFISSCHRIQEDEVQLYDLLERIIHEMRNRSLGDTQRISDELQGHSDQVSKLLRGAVKAVLSVGNNTLAEVRRLVDNRMLRTTCGKEPCSSGPIIATPTPTTASASTIAASETTSSPKTTIDQGGTVRTAVKIEGTTTDYDDYFEDL